MADNTSRFYAAVPMSNGSALMVMFFNKAFQPGVSLLDQMNNAAFYDSMPLNEMLELGATLIACAVSSARQYQEVVRASQIRTAAQAEATRPVNPVELAKLSAFLDGINLDPGADPVHIQEVLQKKEDQEKASENPPPPPIFS